MNGISQYQNVQVMTSDGVRLVIMLYEGALKFNKCAEKAIEEGDIEQRTYFINRSLAIISELSNSLNMEAGGQIAQNLFRLYDFAIDKLNEANRTNDPSLIRSVNRVLGELKAGWDSIAVGRHAVEPGGKPRQGRAANGT